MKSRISFVFTAGLLALSATVAGCASVNTVARPSPFPGAPIPGAAAATAARRVLAQEIVRAALALRGTSYRLGGDTPAAGFDCSGLVRYVFEQEAITVPRTVAEQFAVGSRVRNDDVEAGDLVFFTTTARGATHVGIAIDTEQFVHAPDTGGVVRVERLATPYWSRRLVGVRRVTSVD